MTQSIPSSYPSVQAKPQVLPLSRAAFLTRLTGSVVLLNLFVITLVVLSVHHSYRQYQEHAEITTQNLTQTLESEIAGSIETIGVTLFAIKDEYEKQSAASNVAKPTLNTYLAHLHSRYSYIDGLRIADERGRVVYGDDVAHGSQASVADRPHFILQRDNPNSGVVISKPVRSRINNKWVIVFTRRLNRPDGSFAGIVLASVTLDHFSKTFSALNVGTHGVVTLRDDKLGIIVRHPETESIGSVIGQKAAPAPLQEMVRAGQESGTYLASSTVDGIERAFSYRRVDGYPFFIIVGLATKDYLTEWRSESVKQAGLAVLFALITLSAAWLIYRIWKRQVNLVDALARQEAKFRTVADFTFHWEYWKGPKDEILYMTPSCERITGYTREEFVADPGLILNIIHPEDRHVMDQHVHDIASQAYQEGDSVDFRIVRRDGEVIWIRHNCRAVSDPNGEGMGRRVCNRDISKRKVQEELLRASEMLFRAVFDNVAVGITQVSPTGRFLQINQEYCRIIGYSIEEILSQEITFQQITFPEDIPTDQANIKKLLDGVSDSYTTEKRYIRKDGDIVWVSLSVHLLSDAGKPLYFIGAVQDVTERKRVEAILSFHSAILNNLAEGVFLTRASDEKIVFANPQFEHMFGYEPGELVGKHVSIVNAHDENRPEEIAAAIISQLERTGVWNGNVLNIKKDGTTFWCHASVSSFDHPQLGKVWVSVHEDITERKRTENALQDSESRFRSIIEASPIPYALNDDQQNITYLNSSFSRTFGYMLEDIPTLAEWWLKAYPDPTYRQWVATSWQRGLEKAQCENSQFEPLELNIRCKDGSVRTAMVGVVTIGTTLKGGHLVTLYDITERKKMERELSESLRLMEKKEQAKTRFLAAAGHDMRQPIAAANMLVETLKSTSPTPFQSKLITRLDQSMNIFSGMLERLLDISRFDAGLVKPKITSINLDDLLLWLDQNFAKTAADKQLSFRLFFPTSKPIVVSTDIVLTQSVLMNLVTNAIKYTERGGILVSARLRGDKALVQVWDTGIGITEADIPHVFDEFYQVANPQRSRDGGLGLGLSICQRSMSVLGSKVTCRSRPGIGSVFQFYLPLADQVYEIEQHTINDTSADDVTNEMVFTGKNIVVVEDDVLVAEAMIDLLGSMGGNIMCFHSAEDALRDANIEYADYYIVDYMLGGEHNGIQFLNMLRQKFDKPIRAVLMTGDTSTDFIRKAELFDWPVVHKPVNISKLISKLCSQQMVRLP